MKAQDLSPAPQRTAPVDPYGAAARSASALARLLAALGDSGGAARAAREAREALAKATLHRERPTPR